ncbi:MAG TPA: DUF4116 domain-containing protein, partial [Chlamydiales bacterium]|nr:DUF4116 domain-containing protein [Chlamydiales bacterium]
KNDRDFMLAAIKINFESIYCASDDLKNDRDFIVAAMEINDNVLSLYDCSFIPEFLVEDRVFMLAIIKRSGYRFREASEKLRDDQEFVLEAIKVINPDRDYQCCLQFVSDRLLETSRDIAIAASDRGLAIFQFLDGRLQNELIEEFLDWSTRFVRD